ncbi:unnamed protein product [Caenorhabditis auriculariae]|uniref:AAA+ ATPase domain-containing protein n=1 Tax=Caenorhabditis auriculariae TaxID=2777116 RepID=A0A8S1GZ41_9PELO|nr:unnamed protein product [Caenorhabditis auriculariae]
MVECFRADLMEVDFVERNGDTWTEKYRPKDLASISHQEEVVAMLQNALKGKDLPHLLFYGPPGTGKTSAALAFCHELFPSKAVFKDRVLEMNASDDRGIAAVREKITFFSRRAVSTAAKNMPSFKIIILDEVDAMTKVAQSAMRRIIEDCSGTTRFILICNYVSRLFAPIVSRCAKFRFKPLPKEAQAERLHTICENENTKVSVDELHALVERSEGDLRRAVGSLQAMAPILQHANADERAEYFLPSYNPQLVETIVRSIKKSKTSEIIDLSKRVSKECSGVNFFKVLFDQLLDEDVINNKNIGQIGKLVSLCEKRILDGCDLQRNLLDFMLNLRTTL